MSVTYRPIGVIHSPFTHVDGMPIQPTGETSAPGTAEVDPEFAEGLAGLEGFSHVILVYHLHKSRGVDLIVKPFLGSEQHGIFATRAPTRPNPIGVSVVKLREIEGHVLYLDNLDVLDGSPLLDIKPYVPAFDAPGPVKVGWLEAVQNEVKSTKADRRFR